MLFCIIHHVPAQKFVVLVEIGFEEKNSAKLVHSKITLFLFDHDVDSRLPASRGKTSGVRDVSHGGFKLNNLVTCERSFEMREANARGARGSKFADTLPSLGM